MSDLVEQSLRSVQQWVEDRGYRGYDPGDGLTSYLRPLTAGNIFAERLLQQLVWKAPFNLRPLVGVVPLESTKGRGFMAWGYLLLHKATGDENYLQKAVACLDWLDHSREKGYAGHCWGNHFDFTTRTGRMKAHTPTIVWSGLIGQAFLECYEQTGEERYLDIAESVCRWILTLPRERTTAGSCLSYTGVYQHSVHNSNLLGAAMLARTWSHRPNPEYLEVAREAVRYTGTKQRPEGAWLYAEDAQHPWIDNFHTAYILDSLKRYTDATNDQSYRRQIRLGYQYFADVFFEPSGCPRYYHNRTFPIDIQCAAQAIDTFSFFAAEEPGALALAHKVAAWTIENMQDKTGYFYYRRYPMLTAKTPYFHWGQATMFKALSHLVLVDEGTQKSSTARQPLAQMSA
ncbi:MAG: glycoside hydrolase family 88 protein [Chthoniobacterales bacterium]